ncbi:phage holin family protein [Lacisediminihabitans profunda]|uniref:Phage holin family protein n=1 Tax=Lacisediminihabitans profunda TaxID=2594790 RepID=A0A5C8UM39_9MICO|nr:phage holin family protein [Lacisediminihabitans profunda]TXN29393.1 phage holin family protein [Lacisediminihabitans profunda]
MSDDRTRRSLFALIADLPRLLAELVKDEFEQLKREMLDKLKHAGIGVGLFVAAGLFAFFLMAVLIAAAILGLAVVLPGWAAALIVAGLLLVIVAILAGIGVAQVKQGMPPAPTETIASVKKDVNAIKGIGMREKP